MSEATNCEAKPATKKRPKTIEQWMHIVGGREWCGSQYAPLGGHQSEYVYDDGVTRVFSMIDDGGFVGIGYPDEWQVIMRWKAARMFAWWVLKMTLRDWFGLRSWLYFTALHREYDKGAKRWRYPYARRTRALTRRSSHVEWVAGVRDGR